ncbi:MAG TPA: patatin-like phospholipase family protein [Chitinophagaceae bacterium]|nr:patatin-like phospholipase family protein [Chitinophagaceae bacterium]
MSLTPDKFLNDQRVKKCLEQLDATFGPPPKRPFVVSDVLDNEGHQYVNLVQKGGGVLGVALVGYTYILEKMNIRFIRLAGTSAGAINTALLLVTGKKQEAKSVPVLDAMCRLEFIDLVDGHPAARWLISKFIRHGDFTIRIKRFFTRLLLALAFFLLADFICLGLQFKMLWVSILTKISFVITGLLVLVIGIIVTYIITLLKRLKNSGFGINPGDYFYDWIKERLKENGVEKVTELKSKASQPVPGLHLREGIESPQGVNDLDGDVTFITSDLASKNKIQFPEMWDLFRKDIDDLKPAGFIRASMSIPVFFESYFINDIPCKDEAIKKIWKKRFGETDPPSTARFVDGGILSNFPINLFYNPKVKTPRLPSFGIDLDDTRPEDTEKHPQGWSLLGYFGRIFNTIRSYYDKDFLIKNKFFKRGIGTIKLSEYNWLNFFLSDKDKVDMFVKGAEAATKFLTRFNWERYKNARAEMKKELDDQQSSDNPKT